MGFTEVLPLERVLETPQAQHPGKLRQLDFRGLKFEVPEFPRLHEAEPGAPNQSPPQLGEHTAAVLESAGLNQAAYETLVGLGAVAGSSPDAFAWAPVRKNVGT
jgi:crotonobetainyl-CoA:carnitine CoA-transferase CaiB-like acyl-CoA transferase